MVKQTTPEIVTSVPSKSSLTKGLNAKTWLKKAFAGSVEPDRTTVARLTDPKYKPTSEARPNTVDPTTPRM
jgi:hypothetical protein